MFNLELKPNEKLLAMHRQAEISLATSALIVMLLIYLPSAFLIQYGLFLTYKWLAITWSFLVLLYFLNRYLLWMVNVYIITSERAVAVRYHSLLHKVVSEIPMSGISSVSARRKGLWQTLFGLGDVIIKSGGEDVSFENIKQAAEVKDFILAQAQKRPLRVHNM